jgi:hypothetical protein
MLAISIEICAKRLVPNPPIKLEKVRILKESSLPPIFLTKLRQNSQIKTSAKLLLT